MLEVIILGAFVIVCALIFGKTDTKKDILNVVGLDIKSDLYEDMKRKEFERYCIKAMQYFIENNEYNAKNEKEFLTFLYRKLDNYTFSNGPSIGIKTYYVEFAATVISRRYKDIINKPLEEITNRTNYNFNDKTAIKYYLRVIWENYQYPWPDNWLQEDSYK